jgi:hypothetical protein
MSDCSGDDSCQYACKQHGCYAFGHGDGLHWKAAAAAGVMHSQYGCTDQGGEAVLMSIPCSAVLPDCIQRSWVNMRWKAETQHGRMS